MLDSGQSRGMLFEWDPNKARRNYRDHRVRFEDARYVFGDEDRIEEIDDRIDYAEERWRTTGMLHDRVLVVAYTEVDGVVRLISARKADDGEETRYFREKFG